MRSSSSPAPKATRPENLDPTWPGDLVRAERFADLIAATEALLDVSTAHVVLSDAARLPNAFLSATILSEASGRGSGGDVIVVPDVTLDPRFANDPLVAGPLISGPLISGAQGIRFFCGAPIRVNGLAVGALCAFDRATRSPSSVQIRGFAALARQAGDTLELDRTNDRLATTLADVTETSFDATLLLSPILDESGTIIDFRFDDLNSQAGEFFGVAPEDLRGLPVVASFPSETGHHLLDAFRRVLGSGEPFEIEFRSQLPARERRWTRLRAARSDGRVILVIRDVHERRGVEQALAAAKARLSATFDAVQVGIMVVSPDGQLLRANPEAERALGIEAGTTKFVGAALDFEMLTLDGSPMPTGDRPVAGALMGQQVRGTMMRLRWADGREMCIHANAVPLWNEGDDRPYAAVCSFLDVTAEVEQRRRLDERFSEVAEINIVLEAQRYELERANEKLAALATTDGLTGLLNHRAFQERLEVETNAARRTGTPLSLLLMDVDRFKSYNDEFGHPAGDAILREFARVLTGFCRVGDLLARYGGEEFVAILPNTDELAAIAVAERFRLAVESAPWPDRPVTASFGAATLTDRMDGGELIRSADAALYRSKREGRNRTTHAHEPLRSAA